IIFQLSKMFYRDNDGLSSLSMTFIAMLLFNPMLIYSVGFQLSVSATLGILLFAEPLLAGLSKILPRLTAVKQIIAVSISAQLGAFPIIVYAFNCVSVYSLLSNLLVVPMLTFIMISGLLLAAFGKISFLGSVMGKLCSILFGYVSFVAGKISRLPYASVTVGGITVVMLCVYIFIILSVYSFIKKYCKAGIFLAVLTVFAVALSGFQIYERGLFSEICFLNVGRGDCTFINIHNKTRVMIDGGKQSYAAAEFMSAKGISRVDCAIVSSNKSEHAAGLLVLIQQGYIKNLYLPENMEKVGNLLALKTVASVSGTAVHYYKEGDSIYINGLTVRPIDCDGESVQLTAEYEGFKLLLCGDNYMKWEDCDAVKMPNHGSGSYNYINELNRHTPSYAIITASGNKALEKCTYLDKLNEMEIPYYVPAVRGTVTFEFKNGAASVRTTK
ncbi:MAG: ComEC/Rec2 family competence protein, partial [Clostridia bacterium]